MKSKQLYITVAWLCCATLLVGLALWQAKQSVARDAARPQELPPPKKTRHAIRNAPVAIAGDPVTNYLARCEKGMTVQELAWVLADYRNAGLDLDWTAAGVTNKQRLALRGSQLRWYRRLLVAVLQLDATQTAQVTTRLAEIFSKARDQSELQPSATTESAAREQSVGPAWMSSGDLSATQFDPSLLPQNLCELTPAQLRLLQGDGLGERAHSPHDGFLPLLKSQVPEDFAPRISVTEDEPPSPESPANPTLLAIEALKLQPAQLQWRLLRSPGLAAQLQQALDRDSR
jgi:hypothetical protein